MVITFWPPAVVKVAGLFAAFASIRCIDVLDEPSVELFFEIA